MDNIKLITPDDSLEELADLIHRAYRRLADLGFKYWGTHQTVEDTKRRISQGECFIRKNKDKIIGTIVLRNPKSPSDHHWYNRPEVTCFNQFAVDPDCQRQGVGSTMMDFIEHRAKILGMEELACDTAEGATHLVNMYLNRGYRIVDTANWGITNYTSVIMSKKL